MSITEWLAWLEASPVGRVATESLWGFPILVAVHIMGLTVSVGTIVWFDLRLLGVALRGCPVTDVYRRLIPWATAGFLVMVVSGGWLFVGYATSAYVNIAFRIKIAAIVLAGVNALVYHRLTERHVREWDALVRLPLPARMAGLVSIALWVTAILAGRMMSYTMF